MKIKNKVSLSLALLLALNVIPQISQASQEEPASTGEVTNELTNEAPLSESTDRSADSKTSKDEGDKVNELSPSSTQSSPSKDEPKADPNAKTEEENKKDDFSKRVDSAKKDLKKYLKSMDETAIDNPSINFENSSREELKKALAHAKELLADNNIDENKLKEIEKIPFKKKKKKKQGLFRDFTHKALVDFKVEGDRTNTNPHNNKKYVGLTNNKFFIKSKLKGLKKSGEDSKKFIKLNYVTDEDYNATKVDGVSSSTPKYNKQELPKENYKITEVDGGYEVEILKMPENTKFIKPIVLMKLADGTYFENGDLVFAKNEHTDTSSMAGSSSETETKDKKNDKKSSDNKDNKKDDPKKDSPKKDGNNPSNKNKIAKTNANVKTGITSLGSLSALIASSLALVASKKRNK